MDILKINREMNKQAKGFQLIYEKDGWYWAATTSSPPKTIG